MRKECSELTEVRCPKCGKLLGKFTDRGEIKCPKCRDNLLIAFEIAKCTETLQEDN